MPFAGTAGSRLYWRIEGQAGHPVLLLLNSIGTDMSLWDSLAPYLTSRFRLLRMDARGHGASDTPAGDYSLDDLAADALAVMDAAGVETAAVCGLSLGGMTAMTLTLRAPERFWGLICACTSARMDAAAWRDRVETVRSQGMAGVADVALGRFFSRDFARAHPTILATIRAGLLSMSPQGYAGCGAAIRDMQLLERLDQIRTPTLVIFGEKDISTPFAEHGFLIATAIAGAATRGLKAGHLACIEDPGAFADAVVGFLAGLTEATEARVAEDTLFAAGLANRRQVLGDAWVDAALANRTAFNADFQAMITRYAWHEIWGRPGLDHRTRRLLVIAITTALGRWEEFRLHVRAGLRQGGFTQSDLQEVLMQAAIYAGVPAANTAFAEAARVISEISQED